MYILLMDGKGCCRFVAVIADPTDLVDFCVLLFNVLLFFLPSFENQSWTFITFESLWHRAIIFFHYVTQLDYGFVSAECTEPLIIPDITSACKGANFAGMTVQDFRVAGLFVGKVDAGDAKVDAII